MKSGNAEYAGIVASIVFWPALISFAAIRPEYSHATKAISELGVIGAPNAILFNIVGFMIPGILLSICGGVLAYSIDKRRSALWWLLVVSGLGFAATSFPAEMDGGSFDMDSVFTQTHLVMTIVSAVPWIIAMYAIPSRISKNYQWRSFKFSAIVLAIFCTFAFATNVFSDLLLPSAALGQRVAFGGYFAWFFVMSLMHLSVENKSKAT